MSDDQGLDLTKSKKQYLVNSLSINKAYKQECYYNVKYRFSGYSKNRLLKLGRKLGLTNKNLKNNQATRKTLCDAIANKLIENLGPLLYQEYSGFPETTDWMEVCRVRTGNNPKWKKMKRDYLKDISKKLNLPYKSNNKKLCNRLYQDFLNYQNPEIGEIHKQCQEQKSDILGIEFNSLYSNDILIDSNKNCYSLEGIKTYLEYNQPPPYKNATDWNDLRWIEEPDISGSFMKEYNKRIMNKSTSARDDIHELKNRNIPANGFKNIEELQLQFDKDYLKQKMSKDYVPSNFGKFSFESLKFIISKITDQPEFSHINIYDFEETNQILNKDISSVQRNVLFFKLIGHLILELDEYDIEESLVYNVIDNIYDLYITQNKLSQIYQKYQRINEKKTKELIDIVQDPENIKTIAFKLLDTNRISKEEYNIIVEDLESQIDEYILLSLLKILEVFEFSETRTEPKYDLFGKQIGEKILPVNEQEREDNLFYIINIFYNY